MAINGNFTQSPQKHNNTKQGKSKKDLTNFAGKQKSSTTLPEQHTDSQEIRQRQNRLMKSRALNNNKISFQGYSKSITKSQSGSHTGSGGSSVSVCLDNNDVSKEIGDGYDVTGGMIYDSTSVSNSSGTAIVNGRVYVADPGEHITKEIREKYNFIAEPSVRGAVLEGNLHKVWTLLNTGINIDTINGNKGTPLHAAAEQNNLEMVKFLVEKGANVNETHRDDFNPSKTPLSIAAEKNNLEMVKFLVDKGGDVNAKAHEHLTPLRHAAGHNNLEMVKFLVDKGADVTAKTNSHINTPLHLATEKNNLEMVKLLVAKGADINAKSHEHRTSLHHAAKQNNLEMVKFLVDKGADVNVKTVYIYPGEYGKTPLHYATEQNNLEMVKLLVGKGADIEEQEVKASERDPGIRPLHNATEQNNIEMVNFLIDKGADVNAKDVDERIPLYFAAKNNNLEMAKLLLERGADAKIAIKDGHYTPIHAAVGHNNIDMVELLVENGMNVNGMVNYGTTPLGTAAEKNNLEMVKLLVSYGADINNGSPWHYAKEGSEVKKYLENYSIAAVPTGKTYDDIFQKKMRRLGDGFFGDIKRFLDENDIRKEAQSEVDSGTITYQNRVLEVTNKAQNLKAEGQRNLDELRKRRASQKEIDEATRITELYKKMANPNNIEGFGRLAGYRKEKDILIDNVCSYIGREQNKETVEVPAGVLFYGPMGTGKTTFAIALARQTGCDLVDIEHEDTPEQTYKRIKEEAANAKERFKNGGKRTIISIDEIEVMARHADMADKLKRFMQTSSEDSHCTLFVTTNYPDKIDKALLRDGRFIKVGLPPANKENAAAIIKHYAEAAGTTGDIKYEEIAEHLVKHQPEQAFSNARIKEVIKSMATPIIKANRKISHSDLLDAVKNSAPDILKEDLELFAKNMKLLR